MNPLDNSEVIMHETLPRIFKCYQNRRVSLKIHLGSRILARTRHALSNSAIRRHTDLVFPCHWHLQKAATSLRVFPAWDVELSFHWGSFVRDLGKMKREPHLEQPPRPNEALHIVCAHQLIPRSLFWSNWKILYQEPLCLCNTDRSSFPVLWENQGWGLSRLMQPGKWNAPPSELPQLLIPTFPKI